MTADTRIHDCDMDGPRREEPATRRENESAGANVARRNVMREVDNGKAGIDAQHDPFYRSNEPVGEAEIRCQSDDVHAGLYSRLTGRFTKNRR